MTQYQLTPLKLLKPLSLSNIVDGEMKSTRQNEQKEHIDKYFADKFSLYQKARQEDPDLADETENDHDNDDDDNDDDDNTFLEVDTKKNFSFNGKMTKKELFNYNQRTHQKARQLHHSVETFQRQKTKESIDRELMDYYVDLLGLGPKKFDHKSIKRNISRNSTRNDNNNNFQQPNEKRALGPTSDNQYLPISIISDYNRDMTDYLQIRLENTLDAIRSHNRPI
jgi:hypothetical protein